MFRLNITPKKGILPRFVSSIFLARLLNKDASGIRKYKANHGYRELEVFAKDPETGQTFDLGIAGMYPTDQTGISKPKTEKETV